MPDAAGLWLRMAQTHRIPTIHAGKEPRRLHYIPEWTARRKKKQADLVRATGADKGTVSRWFSEGKVPREAHLKKLAAFLECGDPPEVEALFRHPDEDWMLRLFRQQTQEMRISIRDMMEANVKRRGAA